MIQENDITINGLNWSIQIIKDYNTFFGTNHTREEVHSEDPIIGTQQSFICDIKTFEKLGTFLEYLIEEKGVHDKYVPMPATLFERYVGIFFHFELNKVYLRLPHTAIGYQCGYRD